MHTTTRFIPFSSSIYIALRVLRKYLLNDYLLTKKGSIVPFYENNINQISPVPIVDRFFKYCEMINVNPVEKKVLEIGIGETNSTGYEMTARGITGYLGYEPFLKLNKRLDKERLIEVRKRYPNLASGTYGSLKRFNRLSDLNSDSVDMVFSHSVLEHVEDMVSLNLELKRILKKEGCMIHYVDYRDHFFRYPYHFLLFSKKTWARFLDPGHLPRYRVSDHISHFEEQGFSVDLLELSSEEEQFHKIEQYIHPSFNAYDRTSLATTCAALFVRLAS